ncbi:carboxypeptidase-like regulatory domain-containing protein [Terrimonas sp. NA20]|uniref:Carboxypeptidase-like regulatory domain-containing protein n=1 Tax=Terrimonas ginsenosidimutans TaxID=2908004 RepID=A0ABS9KLJ0_9BACT|nr:carboxypeptidase-like regulatory domain-containing protein [Terrimonas ginsenosidimutans]MCG2613195.1 carboxypeptidase-like regulatory domain-containing protein [Terrimonas ginsenosidimutans]
MRIALLSFFLFCLAGVTVGQFNVSGKVISNHQQPVSFATLTITALDLSAVANDKGEFNLRNVPAGKHLLSVSSLGFAPKNTDIEVVQSRSGLVVILETQDLTLKEVAVTAKRNANTLSTSYLIDRTALDHMQILSVGDVTSLLPGGKTNRNLHLAGSAAQMLSVNGVSGEGGNALFGVAVELDGVRLSNNAIPPSSFQASTGSRNIGADIRNIASTNIESVEIVTGLPSVEYGDLSNGMVKINTRKGKSPLVFDVMTKPNTKQVALGKGFDLGDKAGVFSFNLEHTRSISNLASPYTTYVRNNLGLNYSNVFNRKSRRPISFEMGLNGNLGGYNSKSDPDLFGNTYVKEKDNALRGNMSVRWQLNKPWITSLEASGTFNLNNRSFEESSAMSTPASRAAIHTMQTGYFVGERYADNPNSNIILIDPGYWYEIRKVGNDMQNYTARLKANWSRQINNVSNRLLVGGEWSRSYNGGEGEYYQEMRYAPTWRPYPYSAMPAIVNYAFYAEDRMNLRFASSTLRFVAGLRSDITSVAGSAYGNTGSLSPRFSAEYSFFEKAKQRVTDLSVRVSWGKTVKLPSFNMLFPVPRYTDILSFAPGTTSDGKTFYAYYTQPNVQEYNPDLKWQQNTLREINLQGNIDGVKFVITASYDKTTNPYIFSTNYTPFTHKFTDQSALDNFPIPINNRIYTIDQQSGIVTAHDRTGALPSQALPYREITRGISNNRPENGSPVYRKRLAWIIDFKQIAAIRTGFRVDGNYYQYKGLEQTVVASMPVSNTLMADGSPYKYVGYYTGGSVSANGSLRRSVDLNVTSTTHIPALRLIFTARLECSLYDFGRNLSEYKNGQRGYVLDNQSDFTPSSTKSDIYGRDQFIAVYPEYYTAYDDMQTKVPFAEKLIWAKDNDRALYNELVKLVVKNNYNYYYNPSRVSVYYSANIGITKELGKAVSITFNAINFINNISQVRFSQYNGSASLFGSSYIPAFYYGLSFRLKI